MVFKDICADFLSYMEHERGCTPATVRTYREWLNKYRRWCDGEKVGESLAERFNASVLRRYLYSLGQQKLRPRTVRGTFHPLKTMGGWLVENKVIDESPLKSIVLPQRDSPVRPVVSQEEFLALVDACDRLRTPRRRTLARAIILTFGLCGLRFSELSSLKLQDVRFDLKTLTVVQGKGKKSRTLYPAACVLEAIEEWVRERSKIGTHGNQISHDWLWASDTRRRVGEVGMRELLAEVKAAAGFEGRANIVPHAFRRFFATTLAGSGGLQAAQRALGHSDVATTFGYLASNNEAAKAMQALDQAVHVPPPQPRHSTSPPAQANTSPPADKPTRAADLISRRRRLPSRKAA
jgi:site-specific recombinase XerD